MIARADDLARDWSTLSPLRARVILLRLIQRIEVSADRIAIRLFPDQLCALLDDRPAGPTNATNASAAITIPVPAALCRAGKGIRMIVDPADPSAPHRSDPILIRAIVRAYRFNEKPVQGRVRKFGDLTRGEKLHRFYLTQLLRLAYFAPDITAAILDGKQPARLTATQLIEHPSLPLGWPEQRRALGFPNPA